MPLAREERLHRLGVAERDQRLRLRQRARPRGAIRQARAHR